MDQYITEQRGTVLQQGHQNKTGPLLNYCHCSVSQASHMHLFRARASGYRLGIKIDVRMGG